MLLKRGGAHQKSFPSYWFGPLLKLREHSLDVLEVGSEWGVMEREIPLPRGAALQRQNIKSISDPADAKLFKK